MQIERTFRNAFAAFQATAANSYYWAAQSEDGTVVITMWLDELQAEADRLIYGLHPHTARSDPSRKPRPAAADRIRKLEHARDHCNGRLRGIIIDRTTDTKSRRFLLDESLWMNVHWVEKNGKFCIRSDRLKKKILDVILPILPPDPRDLVDNQ